MQRVHIAYFSLSGYSYVLVAYNEGAGMCVESTHSIFLSTGSRQVLLEYNEGAGMYVESTHSIFLSTGSR